MTIETENPIIPRMKKGNKLLSKKLKLYDEYDSKKHNESFFTPWTLIHLWVGIVLALLFKKLYKNLPILAIYALGLFLHTLYEIKDTISYFKKGTEKSPTTIWHNSFFNSIGDTIGFLLGMYIGIELYMKASNKTIFEILVIYMIVWCVLKAGTTYAYWTKPRGTGTCPAKLSNIDQDFQDKNPECYFLWG